jgi:pantoate kinase
MIGAAYAPAHITGFFAVRPDVDPAKAGSIGCGLCLEAGVTARITMDTSITGSHINLNGKHIDLPTVEYVIEKLLGNCRLIVELTSDVPLGFGFGVSGAAALASALAINAGCGFDATTKKLAATAHCAEVVNRTGMGDVVGQYAGGVVIRIEPGAPGNSAFERIPISSTEVSWVCFGEMSTTSVLSDEHMLKNINKLGEKALKMLLKQPTLNNFMSISKKFAVETGLITSRVQDAVEAVEAQGGMASMAMLGDTVFALEGTSALSEFGSIGRSRISMQGAHYLPRI